MNSRDYIGGLLKRKRDLTNKINLLIEKSERGYNRELRRKYFDISRSLNDELRDVTNRLNFAFKLDEGMVKNEMLHKKNR